MSTDPYASRRRDEEEIAPRLDPVIWGESEDPLDSEQLRVFDEEGFVLLPELFSPAEVADLAREADRLVRSPEPVGEGARIDEPDSEVTRSIFRPHRSSSIFAALVTDPRLTDAARQILASDVYVHQHRINLKPALHGREFFWHSDFETWHIEDGMPRMRAVSASLMLDENDEFNGPLLVIPGSHRSYVRCVGETPPSHHESSLRKQEYGVPSRAALDALARPKGLASCKGAPGSVVFFDCNLMHGSVGNLSPGPRTNVFVVYNSTENRLQAPFGGQAPRPAFLAENAAV